MTYTTNFVLNHYCLIRLVVEHVSRSTSINQIKIHLNGALIEYQWSMNSKK